MFADKITNLYRLTNENEGQLLQKAVKSKCKEVAGKIKEKITKKSKRF